MVDIGRLADENLAGQRARMGGCDGVGGSTRFDTLSPVATGLPIAFFSGAYPAGIARAMVDATTLAEPDLCVFVGHVDGAPVSTSILSVAARTAGVHTVATPPEHRGRGHGAALSCAAVAEGERRGCDHAVLRASPDGVPVYRAMGFEDIGRYVQLEHAGGQ